MTVLERELYQTLAQWLNLSSAELRRIVSGIGRPLGAPWGADEKAAAAGAWLGLQSEMKSTGTNIDLE